MAKAPNPTDRKSGKTPSAPDARRGGPARAIADLLPQVGGAAFRRFGFIQGSLVCRWREIVGPRLADVTEPAMIRFPRGQKVGGTLHLTISSAHAPMLSLCHTEIIAAVNRFFGYGAIAQLRMAHGKVTPAPDPPLVPPPAMQPLSPEISDGLRAIADDELRTILERMAARLDQMSGVPPVR